MSPFLSDSRWGVDWVRVIANLQAQGLSRGAIAERCFVAKGSIDAYASEDMRQRPEHSTGERLIALWCEVLSYSRADVPMYRRGLSVSELMRSAR
ncbi:MAG TPA: hypothetical protein VN201_13375 [Roseateles sp.]|nr:hypothetical protein [Roseateles sp.]